MARHELVLVACGERELLERAGDEIVAAGRRPLLTRDSESALRLAIEAQPRMAMLAWDLTPVSGGVLCRQLRRLPGLRTAPIVLMSSDGRPIDDAIATRAGATEYATSLDSEGIASRLRRYLDPVRPGG